VIGQPGDQIVQINWITNPFRAEKFAGIWQPAAEAVLDYGARGWAFLRSGEDPQEFIQLALFDDKTDFDRYWYSPEISEYRVQIAGLHHVPVLPIWLTVEGSGQIIGAPVES
jgi:hypothetical protein